MIGKNLLPLVPLVLLANIPAVLGNDWLNQTSSLLSTTESIEASAAGIDWRPASELLPNTLVSMTSSPAVEASQETALFTSTPSALSPRDVAQAQQWLPTPISGFSTLNTPSPVNRSFEPIIPYVGFLLSRSLPAQRSIFEDSFDGDLSNFRIDSGASDTHGATIQPDPLVAGNALRLEVRREDPLANNKYRSEVIPRVESESIQYGTDYLYQFRTYLPPDWETDHFGEVIVQWHSRPDLELGENWRRPPLALNIDGENYELVNISDSSPVSHAEDSEDTSVGTTPWIGPIERGRWVDWAFHIRWSYEGNGFIRIWKDGRQVATQRGPNTYNDRTPPFWKLGIYKWIWTRNPDRSRLDRRVMWMDDISIGVLE